jgi:hypothetical protein
MRTLILAAIAAACLFMLEGQASAKIAFVRATIVEASVIVIDGKPDFTSGHIVVIRETDDKKERVVVKITPRTLVTQSHVGEGLEGEYENRVGDGRRTSRRHEVGSPFHPRARFRRSLHSSSREIAASA